MIRKSGTPRLVRRSNRISCSEEFWAPCLCAAGTLSPTEKSDEAKPDGVMLKGGKPVLFRKWFMKTEKLSFFFHCNLHAWKSDQYNPQLIYEEEHTFTSFLCGSHRNQAVIIIPIKCTWKFSLFELISGSLIDRQPNSGFLHSDIWKLILI